MKDIAAEFFTMLVFCYRDGLDGVEQVIRIRLVSLIFFFFFFFSYQKVSLSVSLKPQDAVIEMYFSKLCKIYVLSLNSLNSQEW